MAFECKQHFKRSNVFCNLVSEWALFNPGFWLSQTKCLALSSHPVSFHAWMNFHCINTPVSPSRPGKGVSIVIETAPRPTR